MRWKKGLSDTHVYDWQFFRLEDASVFRLLVIGFLVGLVYAVGIVKVWPGLPGEEVRKLGRDWHNATEQAAYDKAEMCKQFPTSKACQPAAPAKATAKPDTQKAEPAPQAEPRSDGKSEMQSSNQYMPKFDVNYTSSQHQLLLTLWCMPFGNRCAEGEEQASVTFESGETRTPLNMPMKASADGRKYLGQIYLGGPDGQPAPNRLILPAGQWHMTAVFPKFSKQASRDFWVSCPPREACVVVDSPIPIQK